MQYGIGFVQKGSIRESRGPKGTGNSDQEFGEAVSQLMHKRKEVRT